MATDSHSTNLDPQRPSQQVSWPPAPSGGLQVFSHSRTPEPHHKLPPVVPVLRARDLAGAHTPAQKNQSKEYMSCSHCHPVTRGGWVMMDSREASVCLLHAQTRGRRWLPGQKPGLQDPIFQNKSISLEPDPCKTKTSGLSFLPLPALSCPPNASSAPPPFLVLHLKVWGEWSLLQPPHSGHYLASPPFYGRRQRELFKKDTKVEIRRKTCCLWPL